MGHVTRVVAELRERGLLLNQDKVLPNGVSLVCGEALAGSWWSHPRAQEIYDTLAALADRADVLEVKLIGGKVTFVFASLWPALLGVSTSGEPWQRSALSPEANQLLREVEARGELEASGKAVKELETRLLVHSGQRHTESGKHVLVLETWARWAERRAVRALQVAEGKELLENAARSLGTPLTALPWRRRK